MVGAHGGSEGRLGGVETGKWCTPRKTKKIDGQMN